MSVFRGVMTYDQDDDFCRKDMLEDLQLAAELGKTLLERNKELEISVKQHQNVIEDQAQEIEYLTKQTVALREVNDSRLRIYEQLEVSIHDLERANHRLQLENTADKKQVKNLTATVETLETKCEEFQMTIDCLTRQLDSYKKKWQSRDNTTDPTTVTTTKSNASRPRCSPTATICDVAAATEQLHDKQVQCDSTSKMDLASCLSGPKAMTIIGTDLCDTFDNLDGDEFALMATQLRDFKTQRSRDQRRIGELEEQLATLVQENQQLENQIVNISCKEEDVMKSMHEELTTLDEVRHGQLCGRCLRIVDERTNDDLSIMDPEEEEDDLSIMNSLVSETRYHSSLSLNIQQETINILPSATQTNNLYRDLVEKYEALVAVNRFHKPAGNSMSLQEELKMSGDFNHHTHGKDTDEESGHGDSFNMVYDKRGKILKDHRKSYAHTPTDFSEAETSSSGFADETSNKSTQTDGRPGSFLCTIADGDDCKFSIYDDASPIDSRFRNRPEYRELFKEIFTVLKKAAENKDEGEDLPLLDDCTPVNVLKVPPVTPATEEMPFDFLDDNKSLSAISDVSTYSNDPSTVVENTEQHFRPVELAQQQQQDSKVAVEKENDQVLTPYKREPLEYLSVSVNVRKKSSSKKNNKSKQFTDRSDSPILPLSPRISYLSNGTGSGGRKRKEFRTNIGVDNNQVWNGTTLQFWSSRNAASPTPSQQSGKSCKQEKGGIWEFKPSTASQDLNKLKRLDLSYAEVLRNADTKKREALAKSVRRK